MSQTKPVTQADLKALREQLDRAGRRLESARQALSRARGREREARKAYEAASYPLRLAEAVAEAMLAEKGTDVERSFDDWHLCEAALGDGLAAG